MSPCPTCGRPLSAAETFCPRCADPETTRMASGRRGAGAAWPSPEAAQAPPPLPPQPGGQQPPAWGQQQYGQQQYGQHQQLPPTQYGQPSPFGQPLPPAPPRGPSGRGRLLAYVGGGAAMLLVVGLGAWAVTGLGGDEGEPSAEPASSATPAAEGPTTPTPTDPPSAEESTEPSPTAPDTADEDQVGDGAGDGAGDAGSATYDLSNGSQSVDLTIVADAPTTITATPDTPEDIVLTVLGPRGAEACRSDASFTDPESCTLRNPQVGGVYEVVVAMYGDVPGGTGVVETS